MTEPATVEFVLDGTVAGQPFAELDGPNAWCRGFASAFRQNATQPKPRRIQVSSSHYRVYAMQLSAAGSKASASGGMNLTKGAVDRLPHPQ